MKTYLIDFENVKSKGLVGIDHLTEEDSVVIFYSENADTISFEMHQKVMSSKAEVDYLKVHVGGKNALDFQLSTMLGYLVAKDAYSHIFVISNDKCFDYLHDFWHGKYITSPQCMVYRARNIAAAINYAGGKARASEDAEASAQEAPAPARTEQKAAEPKPAAPSAPKEEPAPQKAEAPRTFTIVAKVKDEPEKAQEKAAEERPAEAQAPQVTVTAADGVPDYLVEHIQDKSTLPKPMPRVKAPEHLPPAKIDNLDDLVEHIARKDKAAAEEKKEEPAKPAEEPIKAEEPKEETAAPEAQEPVQEKPAKAPKKTKKTAEKKADDKKADEKPAQKKTSAKKAKTPEKAEEKAAEDKGSEKAEKPQKKAPKKKPKAPDTFDGMVALYLESEDLTAEEVATIVKCLAESKDKEDLHNLLAKEFKGDATDLYKLLRAHYNDLTQKYREEKGLPDPDEVIVNEPETAPAQDSGDTYKTEVSARLAELLGGLCNEEEKAAVDKLFFEAETKQQFYIRMIKHFRKDKGIQFYNAIKAEYSKLK